MSQLFSLRIPASSANLGPGFDSFGLALQKYLTLYVERNNEWVFQHQSDHLSHLPTGEDHFIFQVAQQVAKRYERTLPPCRVMVESDIPLARGLGSSASAVVAGVELANHLLQLNLSTKEKISFGIHFEGHPDNISASLLGGFIINGFDGKEFDWVRIDQFDVDIVMIIPPYELKTELARSVLPRQFQREEATKGSSIANLVLAALLQKDYEKAGDWMEKDLFHEPYRASLIHDFRIIRKQAKYFGAFGTTISGAGPTMISIVPKGFGEHIQKKLSYHYPSFVIEKVGIEPKGVQVQFYSHGRTETIV
jgi:homoserine kinase